MQPCNRIYYSNIYWRLNMFRAAYRSSSGAPNCICSLQFIYPCCVRTLSRLGGNSVHISNAIIRIPCSKSHKTGNYRNFGDSML